MTMTDNHPNVEALRAIYADLSRIGEYSHEHIVLHTADRAIAGRPAQVVGKQAVLAKELELIRLTGDTLVMEVHSISANDYFGAVLGILRAAAHGESIGMPFCGLWRFEGGLILEHWENAYDAGQLLEYFVRNADPSAAHGDRSSHERGA